MSAAKEDKPRDTETKASASHSDEKDKGEPVSEEEIAAEIAAAEEEQPPVEQYVFPSVDLLSEPVLP